MDDTQFPGRGVVRSSFERAGRDTGSPGGVDELLAHFGSSTWVTPENQVWDVLLSFIGLVSLMTVTFSLFFFGVL